MNQPINNQPSQGQSPMANVPFEQPAQAPVAPGQTQEPQGFAPTGMQPEAPKKTSTIILIVVLAIVLIAGGLFLASYQGLISLGGIEKYWKSEPTNTATTTTTTTETSTTTNTSDAQRKSDLAKLKNALKTYYASKQAYPVAETAQKTSDATNALTVLVPDYIPSLPVDPLSPAYYYGYKSNGTSFEITAVLEDTTDPAGIQAGTIYLYKVTDSSTETTSAN